MVESNEDPLVYRAGHLPGAVEVDWTRDLNDQLPWARAIDPDDGTFLPADALEAIYLEEQGLDRDDDVIAYCRIGERSSHTWFVSMGKSMGLMGMVSMVRSSARKLLAEAAPGGS